MVTGVVGKLVLLSVWMAAAVAIVTAAAHPDFGAAWESPATAAGIGAVGLGLCLHARQRCVRADAAKPGRDGDHPR